MVFAGTLNEIANKLKNLNKKAQLIYALMVRARPAYL